MIITPLPLDGLYLLQAEPFCDHRGQFARHYCARELAEAGLECSIVQVNHSITCTEGAVRGMHYQKPPHAEIKIVRCLRGACFDVAVDMRQDSPTYLQWFGVELTPENRKAMYIPEGFAHGFQVIEPEVELIYFHSAYYNRESESGIRHDDPIVGIEWPLPITEISEKDKNLPLVKR